MRKDEPVAGGTAGTPLVSPLTSPLPEPTEVTGEPPIALLPLPRRCAEQDGPALILGVDSWIDAGPGTERTARWLSNTVGAATGLPLHVHGEHGPGAEPGAAVRLRLDADLGRRLGAEGYRLTSHASGVSIIGGGPAGLFWGAQTLRQLLGPAAYRSAPVKGTATWTVPSVTIEDAPRFRWRGLMLDVARHFLPKDGVLRYLDLMAAHKLNTLHLHLTDDQGWRVQILRHPRLTEVGCWRPRSRIGLTSSNLWDERPHGGFYTQDDLREIVAYAADRHITVVPEIDIPAHSQAAIAAYPELGVTDVADTEALQVWTEWGLSPNVLNPSHATLRFYEGVLEEILDVFPGPYVHIGGDECPMEQWRLSPTVQARRRELGLPDDIALQHWLVGHFARWLAERGRRPVGWDEIMDRRAPVSGAGAQAAAWSDTGSEFGSVSGARRADVGSSAEQTPSSDLPAETTVMSWRGTTGGVTAARAGHSAVMCPEEHLYLDHRQAADGEPVPVGYVRTLTDVYRFEPVPPELTPEQQRRIVGAQGNAWSETMETPQRLDYQVFPRLAALAEVTWSHLPASSERDTAGFHARMRTHYERLDALGVDYRAPDGPRPWQRRPGIPGRPMA